MTDPAGNDEDMSDNIDVKTLAIELGIPAGEVMRLADLAIEKLHKQGGLEAIRGYSTGVRREGQAHYATVTPALAQLLLRTIVRARYAHGHEQ